MTINDALQGMARKAASTLSSVKPGSIRRELPVLHDDSFENVAELSEGSKNSWKTKLDRPSQDNLGKQLKHLFLPDGSLSLEGAKHLPIEISDLKLGDLCFYLRWTNPTPVQRSIILVQRLQAVLQMRISSKLGSTHCCHCGIIVGIDAAKEQVLMSEMSRHTNGASITSLDFGASSGKPSNVNFNNIYLFYRITDPEVAKHLASVGRAFGETETPYSMNKARFCWLRLPTVGVLGAQRLNLIFDHVAENKGPPGPMMCSEMVTAAGAAAVATANSATNGGALSRLRRSAHSKLFYRDPPGTLPMHLHGALVRSESADTVGYIFPNPPSLDVKAAEPTKYVVSALSEGRVQSRLSGRA